MSASSWAERRRVAGVASPPWQVLAEAPPPANEDEREQIRSYQAGSRSAAQKILRLHDARIRSVSRGDEDARQEVSMALLLAARRFDLSRENSLASYSWPYMHGAYVACLKRSRGSGRTVSLSDLVPGFDGIAYEDTIAGTGATPEDLAVAACSR